MGDDKVRRVRVAKALFVAGFGDTYDKAFGRVHWLTAISWAESGCQELATYTNTDGSVDRGAWQLNSVYESDCSDECAYNVECAAQFIHTLWKTGPGTPQLYNRWITYRDGKVGPLANPVRWLQTYRACRVAKRELERGTA